MLIKVNSVSFSGLETIKIEVEVNIAKKGLPGFDIVGLPNKAIAESRERVKTAIINSGLHFPANKIIVNLAPADLPKEGAFYDLPIAIGILTEVFDIDLPDDSLFFGELSLDGSVRHTKGALLAALFAREQNLISIYLPEPSTNQATVVSGINVFPVRNLNQLVTALCGDHDTLQPATARTTYVRAGPVDFDMSEIIGQEQAKRALEIAAAGGHNVLMVGSPGAGKTMLARAMPGILPFLNEEESLEVTKIYSCTGNIPPGGSLIQQRPFRTPHHNISAVGLIGGGSKPMPGEVSLAHRGVLFLDEFNEFPRNVIEALRQPMEDGKLTIARSMERVCFPSRFIFIASANPCPCGYLYDKYKECTCTPREIHRYRKKISGPILDRIDIHIDVPVVNSEELTRTLHARMHSKSSGQIRQTVSVARDIQEQRFTGLQIHTNAEMKNKQIRKFVKLSKQQYDILGAAAEKYQLSARSYFKIMKLTRTIADLDQSSAIKTEHLMEALQYRLKLGADE